MTETIITATAPEHYVAFAELVRAYVDWCRERYRDEAWFVEEVFGHQSLERELDALAVSYGPPNGKTLLLYRDSVLCGGGAYRRLDDTTCEMKRLFVHDTFRGQGLGRVLGKALIDTARADGFTLMRLDTATRLVEAIGLYKKLGFADCPPYHDYPERFMPHLVFMERPL